MYHKTAKFYDAIYSFKDYQAESNTVHEFISAHKKTDSNTLLDVGCGTGHHLRYLSAHYDATGLDLDDGLLEIARDSLPDVNFIQGDMQTFQHDQDYDAVTCLFGAICYTQTLDAMRQSIVNFYQHLKSGGVCVVEPFLQPHMIVEGHTHALFVDKPNLKIARMSQSTIADNLMSVEFHYLVGENGKVNNFMETHHLALFTEAQQLQAFNDAGFTDVQSLQHDVFRRGLYVAVKP